MKPRPRTRPRRRRRRVALRSTALLAVALVTLFMACWGANRVETLQRRRTRLRKELVFQRDEYRRLMASWLKATERERIVPRAEAELALVEPTASDQQILVLAPGSPSDTEHPLIDYLARAFGRYGEVADAVAKEER